MITAPPDFGLSSENELWPLRESDRGERAKEELVRRHLGLARRLALRYATGSEPLDDLVQVANLALVKAVDRFNPEREIPFGGFATPTILGELRRHFRDRVWTVRVPRAIHDLLAEIERATSALHLELQRTPFVAEIAARIGVEPADVLEALEADANRRTLSLDRPADESDPDRSSGHEWVSGEDPGFGRVEDLAMFEGGLRALDDREREVVHLRFVEDLTQSEIGERMGCSQMHVSRLLRRSLERLREAVEPFRRETECASA